MVHQDGSCQPPLAPVYPAYQGLAEPELIGRNAEPHGRCMIARGLLALGRLSHERSPCF